MSNVKSYYSPGNVTGTSSYEHGDFSLVVERFSTGPKTWDYSVGRVFNKGVQVAEVWRNYGHFWHCWWDNILLCGEDYQGYGYVNLLTGEKTMYLPKEAQQGFGFCWVSAERDENILEVTGCVWACPCEIVRYDLSDPFKLPYPVISRELEYPEDCED